MVPNSWSLTLIRFSKLGICSPLARGGVKYTDLILGKPAGDKYIDDKGIKDEDFFKN